MLDLIQFSLIIIAVGFVFMILVNLTVLFRRWNRRRRRDIDLKKRLEWLHSTREQELKVCIAALEQQLEDTRAQKVPMMQKREAVSASVEDSGEHESSLLTHVFCENFSPKTVEVQTNETDTRPGIAAASCSSTLSSG